MNKVVAFLNFLVLCSAYGSIFILKEIPKTVSIVSIESKFIWQHKETLFTMIGTNLNKIKSIKFGDAECVKNGPSTPSSLTCTVSKSDQSEDIKMTVETLDDYSYTDNTSIFFKKSMIHPHAAQDGKQVIPSGTVDGGTKLKIIGENLDEFKHPTLYLKFRNSIVNGSECKTISSELLICETPRIKIQSSNYPVEFSWMICEDSKVNCLVPDKDNENLYLHENPSWELNTKFLYKNEKLQFNGKNLLNAASPSDYSCWVNGHQAEIVKVTKKIIVCDPAKIIKRLENHKDIYVEIIVGNTRKISGPLTYFLKAEVSTETKIKYEVSTETVFEFPTTTEHEISSILVSVISTISLIFVVATVFLILKWRKRKIRELKMSDQVELELSSYSSSITDALQKILQESKNSANSYAFLQTDKWKILLKLLRSEYAVDNPTIAKCLDDLENMAKKETTDLDESSSGNDVEAARSSDVEKGTRSNDIEEGARSSHDTKAESNESGDAKEPNKFKPRRSEINSTFFSDDLYEAILNAHTATSKTSDV